jgi:hypothetical protein
MLERQNALNKLPTPTKLWRSKLIYNKTTIKIPNNVGVEICYPFVLLFDRLGCMNDCTSVGVVV